VGFSLQQLAGQNIDYSCFGLGLVYEGHDDLTPHNNKNCTNFADEIRFLEPYPNPATDKIYVPVILPEKGNIHFIMTDVNGKRVYDKEFKYMPEGLNLITLDLVPYVSGTYMLTIVSGTQKEVKKIVKR